MQQPSLSLLIVRTSTHFLYHVPRLKSERMMWIMINLLVDIYKRLNTKASKRVLNVYKCVPSFDVINNQMFLKINGVAPIGELRI